jgi:hypothetical protein
LTMTVTLNWRRPLKRPLPSRRISGSAGGGGPSPPAGETRAAPRFALPRHPTKASCPYALIVPSALTGPLPFPAARRGPRSTRTNSG